MSDQKMECPECGVELEFPLSPKELWEHREHLVEDGAEPVRINFNRKSTPDGAKTVGDNFE